MTKTWVIGDTITGSCCKFYALTSQHGTFYLADPHVQVITLLSQQEKACLDIVNDICAYKSTNFQ